MIADHVLAAAAFVTAEIAVAVLSFSYMIHPPEDAPELPGDQGVSGWG